MSVPGVLGCHQIRTRGSADHVFLDLHVWLPPDMRLTDAHALSHVVKDRLMARYPQIADAIIHIEPPPASEDRQAAVEQRHQSVWTARFMMRFEAASRAKEVARRVAAAHARRSRRSRSRTTPRSLAIGNAWSRALFDGPFYVSPAAVRRRAGDQSRVRAVARRQHRRDEPVRARRRRDRQASDLRRLSRVAADAVLAGAATIRGGDLVFSVWHPELVALRASLGTAAPSGSDRRDAARHRRSTTG